MVFRTLQSDDPDILYECEGRNVKYLDRGLGWEIKGVVEKVRVFGRDRDLRLSTIIVKDERFDFRITSYFPHISNLEVEE